MVSTSGSQLLPEEAIKEMREQLLPITTILTPNVPEAILLLADAGMEVQQPKSVDDLIELAKTVQSLGPEYVLLKGGHLPLRRDGTVASEESEKELIVDILCGADAILRIHNAYHKSKNTHGTGCSLACKFKSSCILLCCN
jgi:hydroxymethylpyrimidine kinase/phosphomethylpyrimidine kinase